MTNIIGPIINKATPKYAKIIKISFDEGLCVDEAEDPKCGRFACGGLSVFLRLGSVFVHEGWGNTGVYFLSGFGELGRS